MSFCYLVQERVVKNSMHPIGGVILEKIPIALGNRKFNYLK